MNMIKNIKKAAVIAAGLAVLSGVLPSGNAQAIDVLPGDLLLAIFGNDNEYILNLGAESSLLSSSSPTQFQIPWGSETGSLETQLSGSNPIQWTIIGVDQNPTTFLPVLYAGSSAPAASTVAVGVQNATNNAGTWSGQLSAVGTSTDALLPASNSLSFTSVFGTNSLSGSFSTNMQAGIGEQLYLVSADYLTNALTDIGTADLVIGSSLDLNVCAQGVAGCVPPVPIPASVVLFATGLVGLVGMARRKVMMS